MSIDFNRSARALFLIAALFLAACGGDGPSETAGKKPVAAKGGDSSVAADEEGGTAAPGAAAASFDAGAPVVDSAARFSFELRPKKGDRFRYRLRTDNETNIGGKAMTETAVYNFTISITGLNDDGSVTLEMVHDSIRIRRAYDAGLVDSVARTIAFDTRRPDTSVRGTEQYRALVGKRVNMTIGSDGQVGEVSNVDPVLNAMFGDQKEKVPPKQWEQYRALVKVQGYASIIEQLFLKEAPDTSVGPGATWTRTYDVPALGIPSKNTVRYKLAEVRQAGGRPMGRVVMDLTTKFLQNKIDNELISATIDEMKADGSGEAVMQLDNGWPARKNTTIDMRMKMTGTAKAGPDKGKSNTLSQSVATKLAIDLVDYSAGS